MNKKEHLKYIPECFLREKNYLVESMKAILKDEGEEGISISEFVSAFNMYSTRKLTQFIEDISVTGFRQFVQYRSDIFRMHPLTNKISYIYYIYIYIYNVFRLAGEIQWVPLPVEMPTSQYNVINDPKKKDEDARRVDAMTNLTVMMSMETSNVIDLEDDDDASFADLLTSL